MPRIGSGKRYAQAAFELALERNELEQWQEALEKILKISTDEEVMALLESPRLPFETKKELLLRRLGEIHPLAMNLTLLLIHKGMLRLMEDIYHQYLALLDAHRGVERARVFTAIPLGPEEKDSISMGLGKLMERKVIIEDKVDPSIIGGFIARVGDLLIDGSIRQRLESLKKSLVEAGR
ncbi:MAG: ATP synthase F1 subunit delta [Thermodesulfobacteriota bacterium]